MTHHQKGYIYKANGAWHVRYREHIRQADGTVVLGKQRSKRIASIAEYRRESDVIPLVEDFLRPINRGMMTTESIMTLERFVDEVFLLHVESQTRPSTYKGYRDICNNHLKPRVGSIRMRDFRTVHGERLLQQIAAQSGLARASLKHIKSVLSAVFKHAKRSGAIDGVNPVQDVSIPAGAPESEDTYAYSLDEVLRMLSFLPEPAATVVAAAAFTGMRKGEIRGLRWENYGEGEIRVTHSVWKTHIGDPKTRRSKAPVPVIERLARMLDAHRLAMGNPQSGWIFTGDAGNPLHLDNLARRIIRPLLEKAGLEWHGWHAFRRGLATNLERLGVRPHVVTAILRHSDPSVTLRHYVKRVEADEMEAMCKLDKECNASVTRLETGTAPVVVN